MNYRWSRFWYLRDGAEPWIEDGLLSSIYDAQQDSLNNRGLFQLADLLGMPCLILLGEPGMGKTSTLKEIRSNLQNSDLERYCFFDLGDFTSPDHLVREIFTENPDFIAWQSGDFALHLFLDGLDEALVQVKSVARWLQKNIATNKENLNRLFLRITCRITDWPQEFEGDLKQLWGDIENTVVACVLAPLRQSDVQMAATQSGLDESLFWQEIVRKNARVFAARPITLKFLLHEFRRSGKLPNTRRDLYERGCRELCREINVTHKQLSRCQPEERFAIAARLAALTVFTGSAGISTYEFVDDDEKILAIRYCAGGREKADSLDVYVYEEAVRETLNTALFRGGNPYQWSHKTYAEYLAAWYAIKNLSLPQIYSLIFHPSGRLVPQLEETAAWIASFENEVFDRILRTDPLVLLRSDVATGDFAARCKLTTALLEAGQRDPYLNYNRKQLAILQHPELAATLKDWLDHPDFNDNVRELALDIARECQITELLDMAVAIALNSETGIPLRSHASRFVLDIGEQQHKSQLKPLALLSLENRYYGDLKRDGILATWPHSLSAEELFETLAVPADDTKLIDHYAIEKWAELILPELKPNDLPYALKWVERLEQDDHRMRFNIVDLLDAILLAGWIHLEYPGVLEGYARAVVALWQRHDDLLDGHRRRSKGDSKIDRLTAEIMLAEGPKRLALFECLIRFAAPYRKIVIHNFRFDFPWTSYSDVPWLVNLFSQCFDEQERELIAALIRYNVSEYEAEQFQYIYSIGQINSELWRALNYQLYVELQSDEANRARESLVQRREFQRHEDQWQLEQNRPPLTPSPIEKARSEFAGFLAGKIDGWWLMSYWMMVNHVGNYDNQHEREYNFFALPVWSELNAEEQLQIVKSAPRYIEALDPDTSGEERWWEKRDWIFWPIVAGCRALFLLIDHDRTTMVSNYSWQKWAPSLTYYIYRSLLAANEKSIREQKEYAIRLLQTYALEEVTEAFLWIAEYEDKEDHFFLASRLENLLDRHLASALMRSISADKLSIPNATKLLLEIAHYDYSLVEPLLEEWLIFPVPTETQARAKAISACQILLQYAPNAGWSSVWPAFQQDSELGNQVIRLIARAECFSSSIGSRLTETELADFYLLLREQYPPENDPAREGTYFVTIEHDLASFRESTLRQLVERGTEQSVQQLCRIQDALELDFSFYLHQAELIMRQQTWQPLSSEGLRELFQDQQTRWVQDEMQLLDVIEEVLDELNQELQQGYQGSLPAAIDLWNEYPHGKLKADSVKYTPKDEERLSDYVARFLKRKLEKKNVFIGRETQISRGNLTDIIIETRQQLTDGRLGNLLTVVIEVKGCWNAEIKEALSNQLAERYLASHGLHHGIYLVGRFFCELWKKEPDPSRWQKSSRINDLELKTFLEAQTRTIAQANLHVRFYILECQLKV